MTQVSSLPNEILNAFASFNQDYANSAASTGSVIRPPKGEWSQRVIDIKIETTGQTISDNTGTKYPANKIEFVYQCIGDQPPGQQPDLKWPGARFLLPKQAISSLPGPDDKGIRAQVRIGTERLKGILAAILGSAATDNLMADLGSAYAKVKNPAEVVALKVKCSYRTYKNKQGNEVEAFEEFGVCGMSGT